MRKMRKILGYLLFLFGVGGGWTARGALTPVGNYVTNLPLNCAELLPDMAPFLNFFEAVARGQVVTDRTLSLRIYRVLALREKLAGDPERSRLQNPIDVLIREALCYYREQKAPLGLISFDDAAFLRFLKNSMKELESKVDDTLFQWEMEKQQREQYRKQLEKNREVAESIRREAIADADREMQRLEGAARRKARLP